MALYSTTQELADYVASNEDATLPASPEATQRLLERAEGVVDRALGPWPYLSTGRKLDPAALDLVQRAALSRATAAAAEHLLVVDASFLAGAEDFAPGEISVLYRAMRDAPRVLEELAGHGLVKRSGTVVTPVEPVVVT